MALQDLDPDALMTRMTELGVRLWADGGSLCYDAPGNAAGPELLKALRKHRASLLSRLNSGVERRAPVTFQQRGFLAAHHMHSVPEVYNVATRITFRGPLDVAALRAALSALADRHEALRTRYVQADGQWWQEVLRPRPADLPVDDLTTLSADERDAEIERVSGRLARARFDLSAAASPVLRLLRAGDRHWVLLFVLHHVSCDGWGLSVLLKDLAVLYTAAVSGRPDCLERPMQPAEYAVWQRARPAAGERRLAYWSRQLDGASVALGLPTDRPRPPELSGRGDLVHFTVPAAVRTRIEAYARRHGTTPFAVTAAAFGLLLARLSGQQDIVLTAPYANRERRAHENLAASAVVAFPLRIRVADADSFAGLVDAVARDTVSAISNFMQLPEIAAGTGRQDLPARLPAAFQYLDALEAEIEIPGLTVAIEDVTVPAARGEFYAGLMPTGEVLTGYVEYSTDLWDRTTIERWMEAYQQLLREVVGEDGHG